MAETYFIYYQDKGKILYDSMQPDHHTAVQRLIQLRREGRVAQMFTEGELMAYQQQVQQQPEHQPIQYPIQQQPYPTRQPRKGIVSMPRKRPAITVGMEHMIKPHMIRRRR